MTEKEAAATRLRRRDRTVRDDADDTTPEAHTELRAADAGPRPRARALPPELRDDDDLFNDMPV